MSIQDLLRASAVKRWTIVDTTRIQTLADHSYGVAVLAHEIASLLRIDPVSITVAAIFHDIDEIIIGDLPSPTKARMRNKGINYYDLCQEEIPTPVLSTTELNILTLADKIEAYVFLRDHGCGNHAAQVQSKIEIEIDEVISRFKDSEKVLIMHNIITPLENGDHVI